MRLRTVGGACAVVATTAAVALSGCTSLVAGTAVRASGGPAPGTVDIELLDTGNYPTKPAPPLGAAGTELKGKLLDAARMADFVTGPWEVDPAMTKTFGNGATIIKSAEAVQLGQSKAVVDAVVANGAFLYGLVGSRVRADKSFLATAVYRFRDPQAATDAAKAMSDAALQSDTGDPPAPGDEKAPVPVPGHPEALAAGNQYTPYQMTARWSAVQSFAARGPFVLAQRSEAPGNPDAGAQVVAKVLDLQGPAIDKFQPTDPAKFAELPADPDGLIARMLPLPDDEVSVNQLRTFGRHGTLFYQENPVTSSALFDETGVDRFVRGKTNLYRAKDAAAAVRVAAEFADEILAAQSDPPRVAAEGVNFMPASRCVEFPASKDKYGPERSFYCTASADNVVIEANSGQLRDAQQQVAAQYVMLMAT